MSRLLSGSVKRVEHMESLVVFMGLVLVAVLLAGCGLIREGQATKPPSVPTVGPAGPIPTQTTRPAAASGPTATPSQVGPSPALNAVGTRFGVQVIVQAGNAPTTLPGPVFLQSLHVQTTIAWIYYPGTGENANAWIADEKRLAEELVSKTGLQQIGVHIMPNPRPGTGGAGPRFHMPPDLNAYSAALTGLAKALQPYVRYYSIGNEFSVNIWGGTIDDYATLLRASGLAIKAGDPNALILDSGISGQNYVYPIAEMMVQQGNTQGALEFVHAFFPHATGPIPTNANELKAAAATKEAQGALSWFHALFTSLCPYYDVYQLHDYQGGATIQTVYNWIHSEMQANHCVKPIQAWELGYALDPSMPIDYQDQARNTAQIVTVSAAEGAQLINYFPLRTFDMFRGLATDDLKLLPPGIAFQTTTGKLSGISQAGRLNLGNGASGYQFTRGTQKLFVLWSAGNTTVQLPFTGGATVTDIDGKSTHINTNSVPVGVSPIFVEP